MNSELMVFGMKLNFHSLATFCVMTGAIYCSVHYTKCSYKHEYCIGWHSCIHIFWWDAWCTPVQVQYSLGDALASMFFV